MIRTFRHSPGFALSVILTLALGIGANTAMFSVIDARLLRPLPYPDAERLVMVWEAKRDNQTRESPVSPANVLDWRVRTRNVERIAMFRPHRVTLTGVGEPVELQARSVNRDFFPVLGIAPHRGRLLTPEDDRPGARPVVVISHRLWQQRLGGGDEAIGRTLRANATTVTVAGILPPDFEFMGSETDIWSPMGLNEARDWRNQGGRFLLAVARLKPGISLTSAQREMAGIASQLEREHSAFNAGWGINLVPLRDQLTGKVRTALWVLLAAVGLLLLIACANVANLMLARGAGRQREIAVRLAIGANRGRVVLQLLAESLCLALPGAAAGLLLAWAAVQAFTVLSPTDLAGPNTVAINGRVLAYSIAVAIATGLLCGLAPALTSLRGDVGNALKVGGRGPASQSNGLRGTFVAAQCALTVVLLVGAGLLLRSFLTLRAQHPGLDARNVLTMRVSLPGAAYRDTAKRVQFFEQAVSRLEMLPGVRSASATGLLPFTGDAVGAPLQIEGRPTGKDLSTIARVVLPGYFETMGIPLLRGRGFTQDDNLASAPLRFLVNQEFVRRYLDDADPLRTRIAVTMQDQNPYAEIAGVVGDVREGSLDRAAEPTVYYPHAHLTYPGMTLVMRTRGDPLTFAAAARGVVGSLNPDQPVAEVRSMEQVLGLTTSRQQFDALLLTAFATTALLLAAAGVYSALSYIVTQRTQEVGIRLALGAQASHVLRLVLKQGLGWALLGLGAGVCASLATGRVLRLMLSGSPSVDPLTLAGVAVLLIAVCLVATLLPAWRALRVNPVTALRQE